MRGDEPTIRTRDHAGGDRAAATLRRIVATVLPAPAVAAALERIPAALDAVTYRFRAENVPIGPAVAPSVEKTTPAVQRCKNCRRRPPSRGRRQQSNAAKTIEGGHRLVELGTTQVRPRIARETKKPGAAHGREPGRRQMDAVAFALRRHGRTVRGGSRALRLSGDGIRGSDTRGDVVAARGRAALAESRRRRPSTLQGAGTRRGDQNALHRPWRRIASTQRLARPRGGQ